MTERRIIFGDYDTYEDGKWTLHSWALTEPEQQTSYIEVPGRDGPLDLSTALTDGIMRYKSRILTANFESSEGNRMERERRISYMLNYLDGEQVKIWLPDDPGHYLIGRLAVHREYNDVAHCSVTVTATCGPWRWFAEPTVRVLQVGNDAKTEHIGNRGKLAVSPRVTVETPGLPYSVRLGYSGLETVLSSGVYSLPDLLLRHGGLELTYQSAGAELPREQYSTVTLTYQEAIL